MTERRAEADKLATEYTERAQNAFRENKTPEVTALALIAIAHRLDELGHVLGSVADHTPN